MNIRAKNSQKILDIKFTVGEYNTKVFITIDGKVAGILHVEQMEGPAADSVHKDFPNSPGDFLVFTTVDYPPLGYNISSIFDPELTE